MVTDLLVLRSTNYYKVSTTPDKNFLQDKLQGVKGKTSIMPILLSLFG
jgi:hypothetical protein